VNADIRRLFGGGLLSAVVAVTSLAAAEPALASCLPPQFQPFADDPDTVVLAGSVRQVAGTQVVFDVQLWWGNEPQRSVVIERPPNDPTVITSVDWEPQPGEPWVIIAHREGDLLRTNTCEQLPGTQATVGEVESSLGTGVVPTEPAPSETTASGGLGSLPIIAGVAGLVVAGGLALAIAVRRRRPGNREA